MQKPLSSLRNCVPLGKLHWNKSSEEELVIIISELKSCKNMSAYKVLQKILFTEFF